jgi:hypothetical protein
MEYGEWEVGNLLYREGIALGNTSSGGPARLAYTLRREGKHELHTSHALTLASRPTGIRNPGLVLSNMQCQPVIVTSELSGLCRIWKAS